MALDVFTLFAANAIVLLVMAAGFLAAWVRQRQERYWLTWFAANVVLAAALIQFMVIAPGTRWIDLVPHSLLVLGVGLKWCAARQFTGHRVILSPIWTALAATIVVFALPDLFSPGIVFALVNVLLASLSAVVAWHFGHERKISAPSRYGLVFAYAAMSASFAMRTIAGFVFVDEFVAYLPHDDLLELHLLVAVVYTSASGAFALSIAYERSMVQLRRERDKAQARALTLGELATRDALTGLMNRRAIVQRFAELRAEGFCTLAVLDLDHFKAINDLYGHARGDAALKAAAEALSPDEDCLAVRLGGEEFMLLLRGPEARRRAEQRRQAIPTRIAAQVAGLDRIVTASMGLVELPRRGLAGIGFDELYAAADRLLYEAKEGGRNRTAAEKMTLFAPGNGGGFAQRPPRARSSRVTARVAGAP